MKKKNLWIVSILSLLVSCGGGEVISSSTPSTSEEPPSTSVSSSSSSSIEIDPDHYTPSSPTLAGDDELVKYDDIDFYDNKIRLPSIGGSREVPDPFVYRFNGMYYLYSTTGGEYIKAYKSADLLNWEAVNNGELSPGYVYSYRQDPSSTHPSDGTPFAPEVIYFNGKFYLISSPSGRGHYVLESDSPEGPFTCISGNIGHSIDGSYFIDSDESIYFFGAGGSSAIQAHLLEDDMFTFQKDDNGNEIASSLLECSVGNWNEGPYMLLRNGQYYMTYCGAHYLSRDYRVDYAYAPEGSDILKNSSYTRQDTIALSTKDNFYGLGHSCTVLGPDMDSYYMVYHNMEGNQRYLNLSRLSFNGSTMVANDVLPSSLTGIQSAPFSSYDDTGYEEEGNFMLSSEASGESFTVEFNVVGEGKMIFSYIDDLHYSYMQYKDNAISIHKVINGNDMQKYRVSLNKEYSTEVMHSFRLQHHQGKVNLYFDNIEKDYDVNLYFKGGKVGYEKDYEFAEIGYTAFSNVALGSSDKVAYNQEKVLANAYDEKLSYLTGESGLSSVKEGTYLRENSYNLSLKEEGNRASYRIYEPSGVYSLNMRLSAKSNQATIGVRLDNEPIETIKINSDTPRAKNGDFVYTLCDLEIEEGQHTLSFYYGSNEVSFSEFELVSNSYDEGVSITFDSNFSSKDYYIRNNLNLSSDGVHSDDQNACGVITKSTYRDADVSMNFKLNSIQSGGFVSVLINVQNYSKNYTGDADGEDNVNSYQGYRVEFDGSSIILKYVDFKYTSVVKSTSVSYQMGEWESLRVQQVNNTYYIYFGEELAMTVTPNIGTLYGSAGFFLSRCNAYVQDLNVEVNY